LYEGETLAQKVWNQKMQAGHQPGVCLLQVRQLVWQPEYLNDRHFDQSQRSRLPCGPLPWQPFFLLHHQQKSQLLSMNQEWISS
jgi:hypothetical protein